MCIFNLLHTLYRLGESLELLICVFANYYIFNNCPLSATSFSGLDSHPIYKYKTLGALADRPRPISERLSTVHTPIRNWVNHMIALLHHHHHHIAMIVTAAIVTPNNICALITVARSYLNLEYNDLSSIWGGYMKKSGKCERCLEASKAALCKLSSCNSLFDPIIGIRFSNTSSEL